MMPAANFNKHVEMSQRAAAARCPFERRHGPADLGALVPGADPQLVDLRLGHVCSLLGVVELMLQLPVLGQIRVGLFLLGRGSRENGDRW